MATQNFKRHLFLKLYREGEKNLTLAVCFLLPLKREIKKCLTLAAYFLLLETPGLPACYSLNSNTITIAKIWKKSKCPLTDAWIKTMWHARVHTHTHNGIWPSHQKEWNNAICSNTDGPRDYHTKWSEEKMPDDITYKWDLKYDTNELMSKQKQTHRHGNQTYGYQQGRQGQREIN